MPGLNRVRPPFFLFHPFSNKQLAKIMDQFEKQFEDTDVRCGSCSGSRFMHTDRMDDAWMGLGVRKG
jgi:hypothetical protein